MSIKIISAGDFKCTIIYSFLRVFAVINWPSILCFDGPNMKEMWIFLNMLKSFSGRGLVEVKRGRGLGTSLRIQLLWTIPTQTAPTGTRKRVVLEEDEGGLQSQRCRARRTTRSRSEVMQESSWSSAEN